MDVRAAWAGYGDRVLVTVLAGIYVVELVRWDDARVAPAIPLGVASCLLLLLRQRFPVVMVLLVMLADWLTGHVLPGFADEAISVPLVMLVAVYSLGRWAHATEAWIGAGLVVALIAGFVITDGAHDASDVAFGIAFVGAPWGAGLALRLRRDREDELEADNEQLRRDQEESALRAVAAERARIARELHDVVSHAISVTILQARGGRRLVGVDDPAVRRALDAIEQTNTGALSDMRRLLAVLRDAEEGVADELAPPPSLSRLGELVEQVRSSGPSVRLEVSGEPGNVPPGVDLSAYRIIQEALTNVLKHAGPQAQVHVRVTYRHEGMELAVTNHGVSPPNGHETSGRSDGHGLINIRERVAVVGGTVEAGSGPDGGFVMRAQLPYWVRPGGTG
jgi:signal transduction histidine kinase